MIRVAVDAMGGDRGPEEIVAGAVDAASDTVQLRPNDVSRAVNLVAGPAVQGEYCFASCRRRFGCIEICAAFINQLGDRFDLKDDLVIANEIRIKCLHQSATAILQRLRCL